MSATPPAAENAARGVDLRLARLHLRGGSQALARAELEALAGSDSLDRDGVLDLAEVRWRTGDLQGAAVAATAWLDDAPGQRGPGAALAHVIAAEAAAARGALDEAAVHVEAAAADLNEPGALDVLLAGITPRAAWPQPAAPPAPVGEASPSPVAAPAPAPAAPAPVSAPSVLPPGPTVVAPGASDLVRAGSGLLAAAPERAAILLALALRTDRVAADAVLEALGPPGPGEDAALAFVRGEALRAAGRHDEARIAYASAERLALEPAEAGPPRSAQ